MKLNTINNVKIINFKVINHVNASLNISENLDKFFVIKRIFTVKLNQFDNDNRGRHAHKIDQQIVTCPYGRIEFTVKDGINSKKFEISDPKIGIYVPNHIWTETDYKIEGTVVTCYCSHNYNEDSYIRNYEEYLKFRNL